MKAVLKRSRREARTRWALQSFAFALALLSLPACYSRVTKARGIGADYQHPDRYESSETNIDKWIDSKTGNKK